MKLSIVIPVYYNEGNLKPLYNDLKAKILDVVDYNVEIIMINDGSKDKSYEVMGELRSADPRVKIYSLSRNFGSHAACLCGLDKSTGDCAVIKAADLQEPTELILQMVDSWKKGNNVVLAARHSRPEDKMSQFFSNFYYWVVRKTALPNMPRNGFDIYLIDRKVINVLKMLDERNSAITGQILWSGFKTDVVYYDRQERVVGKSRWTLRKKIRLVTDTLFSFSTVPVTFVSTVGVMSFFGAVIWAIIEIIAKIAGNIEVEGWTTLFIFNLAAFGVVMLTLGVLGNYLWRAFDASRNRPPYIIETDGNVDEERK
jgi:glycosyltransferase involved in cell wall biosynthesis